MRRFNGRGRPTVYRVIRVRLLTADIERTGRILHR
jgi:hypothetical protein